MNKYRAWDKEKKEMYEVTCIDFIKKMVCVLETVSTVPHRWIPFKKAVLMQSTGLKDKNGVEIFESDILRYNKNKGDKHEQGEVCEVIWRSDGCWSVGQLRFAQINSMEVLGNVYENENLFDDDTIYG